MATLDWRTLSEAHKGGSDDLFVGLTAAQMQALTGNQAATATWIAFSFLVDTGGTMGRERDVTVSYSEGGTRDEIENLDEGVIKGAVKQTSKRVLDLLDFLESNYVVCKRLLPLRAPGSGGQTHQMWASTKAKLDKENWTVATGRQDERTRSFTMRLFKGEGLAGDPLNRPYVLAEIDVTDEATWPDSAAPFKETAFPGA
jgi:hypothetical protein